MPPKRANIGVEPGQGGAKHKIILNDPPPIGLRYGMTVTLRVRGTVMKVKQDEDSGNVTYAATIEIEDAEVA